MLKTMNPARAKTVVLDLDGTLVDSFTDITLGFQYAFQVLGLTPPSAQAVRAQIGKPLESMYAHFSPDHVAALSAIYCEHYPKHFTEHTRPQPGVPEMLAELKARGYLLVVATKKRSFIARGLVRALGLHKHLDFVQGTDGIPSKPAPDVIYRALEAVHGEGVWMVGDTVGDVLAGRAARLKTYAVTYGTHPAKALAEAYPDVLAEHLGGLLERLPPLK